VRGRAAIEERFRHCCMGPAKMTDFTFSHLEASIDGNSAYDVGTYEQRLSLPSGKTIADKGKYLVILKRSEGQWKAAYAIYNSDMPATPPPSGARQ
jgi:ketosteroid isomerase-like protein